MRKVLFFMSLTALFMMTSCTDESKDSKDPAKSRMSFLKGKDYFYNNQIDEALKYFDEAIKYDDKNFEAYYYRGCAYSNNFKNDLAMQDWNKAIELKEDYADPYFNIGLLYRRKNDYSMACYYFKLAEKYGRQNMEDYVKYCDYYE